MMSSSTRSAGVTAIAIFKAFSPLLATFTMKWSLSKAPIKVRFSGVSSTTSTVAMCLSTKVEAFTVKGACSSGIPAKYTVQRA